MTVENILNSLNVVLIKQNKRFVLQRTVEVNPSFKALKTFKAVLWFIDNGKKEVAIHCQITDKILENHKDIIWERIDTDLLTKLIINYPHIIGSNEVG